MSSWMCSVNSDVIVVCLYAEWEGNVGDRGNVNHRPVKRPRETLVNVASCDRFFSQMLTAAHERCITTNDVQGMSVNINPFRSGRNGFVYPFRLNDILKVLVTSNLYGGIFLFIAFA